MEWDHSYLKSQIMAPEGFPCNRIPPNPSREVNTATKKKEKPIPLPNCGGNVTQPEQGHWRAGIFHLHRNHFHIRLDSRNRRRRDWLLFPWQPEVRGRRSTPHSTIPLPLSRYCEDHYRPVTITIHLSRDNFAVLKLDITDNKRLNLYRKRKRRSHGRSI